MKNTVDHVAQFLNSKGWAEIMWCVVSTIMTISFFCRPIYVTSHIFPLWYFWDSRYPIKIQNALFIIWIICSFVTIPVVIIKAIYNNIVRNRMRKYEEETEVIPVVDRGENQTNDQ